MIKSKFCLHFIIDLAAPSSVMGIIYPHFCSRFGWRLSVVVLIYEWGCVLLPIVATTASSRQNETIGPHRLRPIPA